MSYLETARKVYARIKAESNGHPSAIVPAPICSTPNAEIEVTKKDPRAVTADSHEDNEVYEESSLPPVAREPFGTAQRRENSEISSPTTPWPGSKNGLPIFIDLETRSRANLRAVGGRRYAADPTTEILSCVAHLGDHIVVWTPGRPAPELRWPDGFGQPLTIETHSGNELPLRLREAITVGRSVVAHNAFGFDAHVWAAKQLPAPSRWIDTMLLARAAGCPGALDAAAAWLLPGRHKDAGGKKLIHRYSKPHRGGFLEPTPDEWCAFLTYNLIDVLLLPPLYEALRACAGEAELIQLDRRINERGIYLDRALAQQLLRLESLETARLVERAETITQRASTDTPSTLAEALAAWLSEEETPEQIRAADLQRPQALVAWMASRGVQLKSRTPKGKVSISKSEVDRLLAGELPDEVRAVLEARRAKVRTTTAKLQKALEQVGGDGRLRDQFVYHRAHTGRWAGQGMQIQNLPRPHSQADVVALLAAVGDIEPFRAALGAITFADAVAALLRPCFRAAPGCVLLIADFASIEARGIAWCAGEKRLLDLFAGGQDVYLEMASRIFGRPITTKGEERHLGKVATLACGYGMGWEKFAAKCAQDGVDLAAAGVTAEQVVEAYRNAYPAIAGARNGYGGRSGGLWKNVERAALAALQNGQAHTAGRCIFVRKGDALVLRLPSGRRLFYRQARLEMRTPGYGGQPKPTLVYDAPGREEHRRGEKKGKGGFGAIETTYGGKTTENLVQAICRDLLAEGLRCERGGLPVILHAHDEIVCEVSAEGADASLERLLILLSTPSTWAEDFPVEVEGYVSQRYAKAPLPAAPVRKARNGKLL
jgi:DNA polymerase